MLDLIVINPPSTDAIYGELNGGLVACEPPLWSRIIAAYIRDRGFSVAIVDAEALQWTPKEVYSYVQNNPTRLICIAAYGHQPSASTQQMVGARAVALYLKNSDDTCKIPIIMVGGHVSALPLKTMREEPINFACVGEGPVTVAQLLSGVEHESILGLVWRGAGPDIAYANPSAPLISIKELHGDAWDLLPMEKYRAHNWQSLRDESGRQPYASIHTSLGCPYKCSFCCINAPFESSQYRMRDPMEVVKEMTTLYGRYGVKIFKIVDEMFVLNERHYTAIAKQLIKTGLGAEINIWAYARVDTVKPATLDLLSKAGFRWLALGIESGSKHVRDGAQKALKSDDIISVVRAIQQAGINVIGNYIFGLPDDDYPSMQATLRLALELNTEYANFYSAMAYPGSKLYEQAIDNKIALPQEWSGYSQHSEDCLPLATRYLTARQVLEFRDIAFETYFTSPVYLNSIRYKFGDLAVDQIQKMTSVKLKRKLLEPELV